MSPESEFPAVSVIKPADGMRQHHLKGIRTLDTEGRPPLLGEARMAFRRNPPAGGRCKPAGT